MILSMTLGVCLSSMLGHDFGPHKNNQRDRTPGPGLGRTGERGRGGGKLNFISSGNSPYPKSSTAQSHRCKFNYSSERFTQTLSESSARSVRSSVRSDWNWPLDLSLSLYICFNWLSCVSLSLCLCPEPFPDTCINSNNAYGLP